MWNPLKGMTRKDWLIWIVSSAVLLAVNLAAGPVDSLTLIATLVGPAFLVQLARGNVWGQLLTIVFAVLYSVIAFRTRYWGEMITYLGMTAPMAALSAVSWLRHPFAKDESTVAIRRMTRRDVPVMLGITAAVTAVFTLLLAALDTPNIFWSSVSIATSFLAAYLTFMRSSWYALAFAANDLVLVVLWSLAALGESSCWPMAVNFAIFFLNDGYGFISWKHRELHQTLEKRR